MHSTVHRDTDTAARQQVNAYVYRASRGGRIATSTYDITAVKYHVKTEVLCDTE